MELCPGDFPLGVPLEHLSHVPQLLFHVLLGLWPAVGEVEPRDEFGGRGHAPGSGGSFGRGELQGSGVVVGGGD